MEFHQIKTPSNLKAFVENSGSDYFTRDAMKFFGDTMRNYGIRWFNKDKRIVELYRIRPVKEGLYKSAYFVQSSVDTAKQIHGKPEEHRGYKA